VFTITIEILVLWQKPKSDLEAAKQEEESTAQTEVSGLTMWIIEPKLISLVSGCVCGKVTCVCGEMLASQICDDVVLPVSWLPPPVQRSQPFKFNVKNCFR